MKVYLAGPEVFRPDALQWAEAARGACAARGLTAMVPLDGVEATAAGIYASNIAMIREADAVVANLRAFRGAEPDSGTCFEVGFAAALGKTIVGYLAHQESFAERVQRHYGITGGCDRDGLKLEDFGLPLNLMLAVPVHLVWGDLNDALACLCALRDKQGS